VFSIASVAYEDAGEFRCLASNSGGSALSAAAVLSVSLRPPEITISPAAVSVKENEAVSFSCAASGTLVRYQWQRDEADIAGATAATYDIARVTVAHAGAYRCVASNSGGTATSAAAALSVGLLPPVITAHPVSRTVMEQAAASFSCSVSGTSVLVRWQKNGEDITGSASSTLTIADVRADAAGEYACVASNSGGSVTSQAATLTVTLIAPAITTQPQAQTATENGDASFTCGERNGSHVSMAEEWSRHPGCHRNDLPHRERAERGCR